MVVAAAAAAQEGGSREEAVWRSRWRPGVVQEEVGKEGSGVRVRGG